MIKRQKRRIILEDSLSDDEDVDDNVKPVQITTTLDDDERKAKKFMSKRDKMDIRRDIVP